MKYKYRLVTIKEAEELLRKNSCNRDKKKHEISTIAKDMVEGRYREETGETIKISKTGMLLDGQNRLTAMVKAGIPKKFLVVWDLEPDIMDVIDSGVKRTSSDVLKIKGKPNHGAAAAIIRTCLTDYFYQSGKKTTNRIILEEYEKDSVFWDNVVNRSIEWSKEFNPLSKPIFGYCYYSVLKHSSNASKAVPFFNGLSKGNTTDLINSLRNKLINSQSPDSTMKYKAKVNWIRIYWNANVTGNKVKQDKTDVWE